MKLKNKDFEILNFLLKQSRISMNVIAEALKIPLNTVYDRVRRLEKSELIKSYSTVINPHYLRHGMGCLLIIKLKKDVPFVFRDYFVNSVIELTQNEFLVELYLSDIYQLKNFKASLRGVGKVLKSYYVSG